MLARTLDRHTLQNVELVQYKQNDIDNLRTYWDCIWERLYDSGILQIVFNPLQCGYTPTLNNFSNLA